MACAAALSARGLSVTVLESHHGHDPRFRGELIHPRGVRALDSLGLKAPLVAAGGVPVKGFAVSVTPNCWTVSVADAFAVPPRPVAVAV